MLIFIRKLRKEELNPEELLIIKKNPVYSDITNSAALTKVSGQCSAARIE